jgi:regulator of nonsense transcripts 1
MTMGYLLSEMKLMHGDELRLRYLGELHKAWNGVGHVIKIPDSILLPIGWCARNYTIL